MATVACSMPASVCSRVARKDNFQLFHFAQRLQNGSFSRLARPLQPQPTLFNWEIQIVNGPRKEGPSKNVMLLSHDRKSIVRGRFKTLLQNGTGNGQGVLQGFAYVAVLR